MRNLVELPSEDYRPSQLKTMLAVVELEKRLAERAPAVLNSA